MESKELYAELERYFPRNLDLMRHLHVDACWEYIITENSTSEENIATDMKVDELDMGDLSIPMPVFE